LHISRKERGRGRNAEVSPRSENRGLCGLARERERERGAAGGGVYMYGD